MELADMVTMSRSRHVSPEAGLKGLKKIPKKGFAIWKFQAQCMLSRARRKRGPALAGSLTLWCGARMVAVAILS
jgi:hypothetical protein